MHFRGMSGAHLSAPSFRRAFLAAALFAVLAPVLPAWAAEPGKSLTVFLVRHAEKVAVGDDPALSEAGEKRAQALADLLRDADIETVCSTDYARTRDTAAPLASLLGFDLTLYDPAELEELAADIRRRGGRSLVVGHSNTTPELVAILGGDPGPPIEEASEYDRLYVVTIGPDGAVSTVLLRY